MGTKPGRVKAGRVTAAVSEVEQDMQCPGRLPALRGIRILVARGSLQAAWRLVGMCEGFVEITRCRQNGLQRHAHREQTQ